MPRLYRTARPGSRYEGSLELLAESARRKAAAPGAAFRTKTGIMAGLGETREEISQSLRDIRSAGVDVFTIGQYLQPTPAHLPVARFVPPAEFAEIRAEAKALGFLHVEAGPLVRSSYHAHEHVPA